MFKSLECITCTGAMKMGTTAKLIIEVFFRLLHYIVTLYLPVVFTAVTTGERVVLGILNSAEDIDVFVVNINAENRINIIKVKVIKFKGLKLIVITKYDPPNISNISTTAYISNIGHCISILPEIFGVHSESHICI